MKFRHVNPHNIRWLIPSWADNPFDLACELEALIPELPRELRVRRYNEKRRFYIDIDRLTDPGHIRVGLDAGDGALLCGNLIMRTATFNLKVPINLLLKGAPSLEDSNTLYLHSFDTECPLNYVGITKRRWFDRLAQHKNSAASGSPYLFHRAIREHANKKMNHTVAISGCTRDEVMHWEEDYVRRFSLYPLGLNMIPGGYAGVTYLRSIGFETATPYNRDEILERATRETTLAGRPNPLCAARWEADQDFVNRIICGHSGRLTVEQVRTIRMLDLSGYTATEISAVTKQEPRRIDRVLRGKVYARVA